MTDHIDLGLKDTTAGCACCATSTVAETPVPMPAAVTDDILVSGMTCSHCVSSVTEQLTGITLKSALVEARETMDPDAVGNRFEEQLLAKPIEVRGNVISDDYGLSMNVTEAKFITLDVRAEAEALLKKIEVI